MVIDTINKYPITFVQDLFIIQEKYILQWNQQKYNEENDMKLLRFKINKQQDPHLLHTSEVLCGTTFKSFKDQIEQAIDYSQQIKSSTNTTNYSLKYPTMPPREYYQSSDNKYLKCSACESSKFQKEQCVHYTM